jgi:hypothetical protein
MKMAWPILVVLVLLADPEADAQFAYTNADGSIYDYSTNADGVSLTITGYTGPPWTVTIPTNINGLTVAGIGNGESPVVSSTGLTNLAIPSTVLTIANYAFDDCTSLTNISLTNGLTSIGALAFLHTSMTNVTIPSSVSGIGVQAFSDCKGLTAITVDNKNASYSSLNGVLFDNSQTTLIQYPSGRGGSYAIPGTVTNIGTNAFSYCVLTNVTIPSSVVTISDSAFESSEKLTNVVIPGTVTSLGNEAYYDCIFLTNLAILNGATSIGSFMCLSCVKLASVTIPDSVTNIGASAFDDCALTTAAIPAGVTGIGAEVFGSNPNLTAITVAAQNSFYSSVNGVLFDKSQSTLIECPGGLTGSYTIPASVTSIGDNAFDDCAKLTNVTIPNSVTNIGAYAFDECTKLTNVTIPIGVTRIGSFAFDGIPKLIHVYFMGNSPAGAPSAFDSDTNATAYYLPGTTGWSNTFAGIPTALWFLPNPQILSTGPSFGVQSNVFGFTISWATNISVVVQACANLANPAWIPIQTNVITNGWFYFSDPQWTNYAERFYRITAP